MVLYIGQVLFLGGEGVFMDQEGVGVHKLVKTTRPISSYLNQTSLVNKGFIIWLLGKFFLQDTTGSPERAR